MLEGQLNVNESILTGEADEIVKKSGDELLSGSFVVSGSCLAQLTKVGEESYIKTYPPCNTDERGRTVRDDPLLKLAGACSHIVGSFPLVWFFLYSSLYMRKPFAGSGHGRSDH